MEFRLQARQEHGSRSAREQRVEQQPFVLKERVVELEAGELPVGVTPPMLFRDFLDREVLPHREVDDGCAHVERAGDLVDERADLAGPEIVGWRVLDGCRVIVEDADAPARP